MEGFFDKSKQTHGTFAITVFVGAGLYLHLVVGGLSSLLSLKSLVFFLMGIVGAPLTVGVGGYLLHVGVEKALRRITTYPPSGGVVTATRAMGLLISVVEVVAGYLATKGAFSWWYG